MSATTVKLDSDLLREIDQMKPATQTLAGYVREALRRDLRRQQMRAAAEKYRDLLLHNAAERKELDEWETARLATVPRRRKK